MIGSIPDTSFERAALGTLCEDIDFCAACHEPISGHPDEPKPTRCEGCNCELHGVCTVVYDELPWCAVCVQGAKVAAKYDIAAMRNLLPGGGLAWTDAEVIAHHTTYRGPAILTAVAA